MASTSYTPPPPTATLAANDQAGDYTLVLSDAGKIVRMTSAAANVLTVPAHADVAFLIGTVVELEQAGAGVTTIAPDAGVTLHTPTGLLDVDSQYGLVALRKIAANEWSVEGRLAVSASMVINTQAGAAYTLTADDANALVRMTNAGANVVTVPPTVDVDLPIGSIITVTQMGAGTTSIAAGAGVTLRSPGGLLNLGAQYAQATLVKIVGDEWELEGRLA